MNSHKMIRIASIVVGIFIFILIVFLGFRIFGTRAADFDPRDVVVSEITQNSVKVSWATGVETQGVIEYGTTPTALNFFAPEPQRTKSHSVDLTLLTPGSTYYFQIRIGDKKYDNGGVPWTLTTRNNEKTVVPTVAPTAVVPTSSAKPTAYQSLDIPADASQLVCKETDCAKIKAKLGQGCSTQDYFKCIKQLSPTASPSATPKP